MKIVAFGDIHGNSTWEKIVRKENEADLFVFTGDYFDSFNITYKEQLANFMSILSLKEQIPDRVVLLFANHDFHYLGVLPEVYSGFQRMHSTDLKELFRANIDKFSVCHLADGHLFSHAGFTKSWCERLGVSQDKDLVGQVNNLLIELPWVFGFYDGDISGYGDHPRQGPMWVRPESLIEDAITGFNQVVGHTGQPNGIVDYTSGKDKIWLIDSMRETGQYVVIKDGKVTVNSI